MEYCGDDWPVMPDGSEYDGKQLLTLVREGRSPFQGDWDVNLLIEEIEEKLSTRVLDIPMVYDGANYYVRLVEFRICERPISLRSWL